MSKYERAVVLCDFDYTVDGGICNAFNSIVLLVTETGKYWKIFVSPDQKTPHPW